MVTGSGGVSSNSQAAGPSGARPRWERGSSCPGDGIRFCGPTDLLIEYRKLTSALRYRNGAVPALRLDPGLPSTACFKFVARTATFDINPEVVGGTGRFADASGLIHSTGSSTVTEVDVDGSIIQNVVEGKETGTLVLAGSEEEDDDEDD